jgi:hypothetical protein
MLNVPAGIRVSFIPREFVIAFGVSWANPFDVMTAKPIKPTQQLNRNILIAVSQTYQE